MSLDDVDAPLAEHKWFAMRAGRTFYAARNVSLGGGRWRLVLAHRAVLGLERGDRTRADHINGDGLDNRRANLRVATAQQNMHNRTRTHIGATSMYRGVHWNVNAKRWQSRIACDGKQRHLGYFRDELEAARAYDIAGVARDAEHFTPNIPDEWVRVDGLWRRI